MKNQSIEIIATYNAETSLRKPQKLIATIFKDLIGAKDLAWRLFLRDISAQYRQSFLGIFWAFFPPIITSLIFIFLQTRNVISIAETMVPYPVYVLIGTTLWQIFSDSLNAPLKTTINAKPYLVKIYFPRESLILASFFGVLFNVIIKMLIITGVLIFFKVQIYAGILLAPFAILVLILLGIFIGTLITPLGMLYSDVSTSLPIVIQLLFFATPVVYSFPDKFPFSLLNLINPVSPVLIAARNLLTIGHTENIVHLLVVTLLTLIGVFLSLIIFRISLPIIIEKLGT